MVVAQRIPGFLHGPLVEKLVMATENLPFYRSDLEIPVIVVIEMGTVPM